MISENSHYAKLESPWLRPLLSHPLGALAVHWLFQGMLQMDPTERLFKLGLDGVGFLALLPLLRRLTSAPFATIGAFLGSHTLNFLFNGQIYGVLKHFGGPRRTWDAFDREVQGLQSRIATEPSILYAAAYGSLARSQWSPSSDLDVRLVPRARPGQRLACLLVRGARAHACPG